MGRAGGLEQRRRGLRHLAGVDQVGRCSRVAEPRRVAQRPLGAQQVEAPEAVLVEQLRRSLDPVPAEDDDPVGVAPDEVPGSLAGSGGARVHDRAQVRFDPIAQVLVVGRQRELSPSSSSGSSTVKPGPRVAISKRTPVGWRK